MVDYDKVRTIAEAEKLTMRIMVLNSLLDTEEVYVQYLHTLLLVRNSSQGLYIKGRVEYGPIQKSF